MLLRPLKRNNVRTYRDLIASLAPLDVDILALEMDDDLDRLYYELGLLLDATPGAVFAVVWMGLTPPDAPVAGMLWWRPDDGNLYVYYDDGISAQWVPAMATVGQVTSGEWYLVSGAVNGVPAGGLSVCLHVFALPCTMPLTLTGSTARAKVAATATADFDLQVNGVSRGTMRWAAGATVATFIWAAPLVVAAGDLIEIVAPAVADLTLADVTWTLRGER